jgi:hypothetical protein
MLNVIKLILKMNFVICSHQTASVFWWSAFQAANPEVPDLIPGPQNVLHSSGSGTGSTQPRDDK